MNLVIDVDVLIRALIHKDQDFERCCHNIWRYATQFDFVHICLDEDHFMDEEYARKLNTSIEYRTWVTDTIPRRYGGNGPKRCPASRENVPILSDRFCGVLLAVASADVRYSRIIADSSKRDLFDAAKIVDVACQEPHDADHEIITNVQRLLRETIRQTFNEDELQDLYADLGVDYDSLPHDTCVQSIRELVAYFARHAKLNELLAACKRKRPNQFNWVEICG